MTLSRCVLMWCLSLARHHPDQLGYQQRFMSHNRESTEVKTASGVELVPINGKLLSWEPLGFSWEPTGQGGEYGGLCPCGGPQTPPPPALLFFIFLYTCLFKGFRSAWSHPEMSVCFYPVSLSWIVSPPILQPPPHKSWDEPFVPIFLAKCLPE